MLGNHSTVGAGTIGTACFLGSPGCLEPYYQPYRLPLLGTPAGG